MSEIDWSIQLVDSLSKLPSQFEPNELAYLSLTSKAESPFRDALAWQLHRVLFDEQRLPMLVAREWSSDRFDLVILEAEQTIRFEEESMKASSMRAPSPQLVIEIKAEQGFDCLGESLTRFSDNFDHDIRKLQSAIFGDDTAHRPDTVFIVVVTHPLADSIPLHLDKIVKYRSRINAAIKRHGSAANVRDEANANLPKYLTEQYGGQIEVVHHERIGEVFGIPVGQDYFIVLGPNKSVPMKIYDATNHFR